MGLFDDIFGGGKKDKGAKKAAELAEREFQLAERQYQDLAPYRQIGRDAINRLTGTYITGETPYTASPGYDFRREEGLRGINRFMAARGLGGSGRAIRGASRYLDDLASQEYDQNFNRLAALAGTGQVGQQLSGNALRMSGNALARQGGYEAARGDARQSAYDRLTGAGINTIAGLAGFYG